MKHNLPVGAKIVPVDKNMRVLYPFGRILAHEWLNSTPVYNVYWHDAAGSHISPVASYILEAFFEVDNDDILCQDSVKE